MSAKTAGGFDRRMACKHMCLDPAKMLKGHRGRASCGDQDCQTAHFPGKSKIKSHPQVLMTADDLAHLKLSDVEIGVQRVN